MSSASRHAGGRCSASRSASSRAANPAGSYRTSGLHRGEGRVGQDDDGPALGGGPHQARGGDPSAHGLLGRAQVGAVEHGPAVEEERRGVPALGPRLGTGRRDDQRRPRAHGVEHARRAAVATGHPHRDAGERAAELLGGTPLPHRRRPQAGSGAPVAGPAAGEPAAPGARRDRVPARHAERPVAVRAPGGGAAGLAGQRRHVAAARDLDEDRAPLQRGLRRLPRHVRETGPARRLVACEVDVAAGREHPRAAPTQLRPRQHDLARPAGGDQRRRLHRARRRSQDECGAGVRGAQRQHLAGVPVGRVRLGQRVVAVVPEDHEAEVAHRGEHRGAGADGDGDVPAADLEEGAVARGRAEVGGQDPVPPGPEPRCQSGVQARDVACVGRHDQHAAPRRCRGGDQPRDGDGRVLTGSRGPHRARAGGLGDEGERRVAQPREQRGPAGVRRPSGRVLRCGRRRFRFGSARGVERALDGGVPGRDGGAQDVGERAGPPVGDGASERDHSPA